MYFLFIPFLLAYHIFDAAKQIFYFVPFLGIFYIYAINVIKNQKINTFHVKSILLVSFLYLFISIFSLIILPNNTQIYWSNVFRDIVITLGPLLLFSIKDLKFTHKNIIWLFICTFMCYLIAIKFDINWNFMSSVLYSNYDFRHEYHFGSVACLFVLYFIYKKDYKFLALSILLTLLVNKRANLLGIIPALATFWIFFNIFNIKKYKLLLFVLLLFYYFTFYLLAINIEDCTNFFLKIIGKSYIDTDTFLTGRLIMQRDLIIQIYDRGIINYIFGNGIGQTEFYLWKTIYNEIYFYFEKPFLAHNDFMKLHFDIGAIGVIIYFFVMYYLYCVSPIGCLIFFSLMPLFLIDNTIIFLYNILIASMIARVDENSQPYNISNIFKFTWHE